ncbi:hypothetical protein [Ornithinimicrobium panacihumi]|uniref:hypothetical protein n=1 Tax=Ornithinimicrobium panacihumi TaxID=2008449 RepID=UPI003F8A837D
MWTTAEDLLSDPDAAAVLLRLDELSQPLGPDQWVSRLAVGEGLGLAEEDVLDLLTTLVELGLARNSERMSSGWRISSTGRRAAERWRTSRTSGRDRVDRTMREILRRAVEEERGVFLRDEWEVWDLHAPGTPPVSMSEREAAMDALEAQDLISSIHSSGSNHSRCEVTSRGKTMLGRPDLSLADAYLGHARSVTYDQRVGIQADTFTNQGAVQTGDHTVQHVTITNDQRQAAIQQLQVIREMLQDPDLPREVVPAVLEAVEGIEDELTTANPARGRLSQWRDQAMSSAAGAIGTEAGRTILQVLIDLPKIFPFA